MVEFGHNLKKYRLISKISQVELANAVGIKQGTIANYENGNRTPTLELLLKLARFLNVSTDALLGVVVKQNEQQGNFDLEITRNKIVDYLTSKQEYMVFKEIEKTYYIYKDIIFVFDNVLTPVMYKIGNMWESGRLTIADEHYAAESMFRMVNWLSVNTLNESPKNRKAVCMSLASEMHTLGIRMISVVLENEGYDSVYIGNNLPTKELLDILVEEKPSMFLISVTLQKNVDSAINLLHIIKSSPGLKGIKILIGGQGVTEDKQIEMIEGVSLIKTISDLRNWLEQIDE